MTKRGSLDSFFLPSTKKHRLDTARAQNGIKVEELKETSLRSPPGLSILKSFITPTEEKSLLSYLDAQKWRTDLSRRTMHFGGTFCLMPPKNATPEERKQIKQTIIEAPKMTAELNFLVNRMVDAGLYSQDSRPEYCIVNEYLPGQGISSHVENFRFAEPVCSLTLAGSDTMRFHELEAAHDGSVRSGKASSAPRTGRREDVVMDRRSLLILRGDARSTWQHEIRRAGASSKPLGWRRVSLTFRVERRQAGRKDGDGQVQGP
ncbi:Hypothetical protein D9617_3g022320 [Elsinoe fawcettii]|nr:Hypothetical protein D9617_3g022320 [Elsinoe fawcettii]